jgi:enterochelin esterase-like enzyme
MRSFFKSGLLLSILSCFELEINCQVYKIENKDIADIRLSIYLPSGYDTIKRCKILYFNDGQTVFGKYGLNVDGTAEELIKNKLIDPIIIVGIHSDRNRTSNYVPYFDEGAKEDFGDYTPNAEAFTQKIIKEVIPFIEKNYNTNSVRGIAGYSFGGLHATWATLNHPDIFTFSGSLSPSYWVRDFEIYKEASKATAEQKYYFDIGTGEWNYYVPMLLHSKLSQLKNIFYYEDNGGNHDLNSWKGQRIKNILLLFAGNTDTTYYKWETKLEIIKSKYTGKFYPRINPVITYSNGLTCSLSYAAIFTLLNAEDGVVNKDGSFRFINPKDLKVKIIYRSEEKLLTINYKEVDAIMKH